jgi:hypothetical protein
MLVRELGRTLVVSPSDLPKHRMLVIELKAAKIGKGE